MAGKVMSDFRGLARVFGWPTALRWLANVALRFPQCVRERNLQPADHAMGPGPFAARFRGPGGTLARGKLAGDDVISGAREIWVRNVYLPDGLAIPPDGVVVDLGANVGNFTALALAHGSGVRVVSVEPDSYMIGRLHHMAAVNGWQDRLEDCQALIGTVTPVQEQLIASNGRDKLGVITEEEFIAKYRLTRIDFLKCDIEGSEFGLLKPGGKLLGMSRQLAVEVHDAAGDRNAFVEMLRAEGFEILGVRPSPGDCIVTARRPGGATTARHP
jgi:FkbM family methyltransferase